MLLSSKTAAKQRTRTYGMQEGNTFVRVIVTGRGHAHSILRTCRSASNDCYVISSDAKHLLRIFWCGRFRYHGWIVKDDGYCEGDAAEWRWFVPHDLEGLIELFSSQENYVEQLDTFMNRTYKSNQTLLPNPYYWAGNEPDILVPWQFVAAGRPDLTQRHTRAVMNFACESP